MYTPRKSCFGTALLRRRRTQVDKANRESKSLKRSQKVMKFWEKILFDSQLFLFWIISKSVSTVLFGDRLGSQKRNIEQFWWTDFLKFGESWPSRKKTLDFLTPDFLTPTPRQHRLFDLFSEILSERASGSQECPSTLPNSSWASRTVDFRTVSDFGGFWAPESRNN